MHFFQFTESVLTHQAGESLNLNLQVSRFKSLIRQGGFAGLKFHEVRHITATLQLVHGVHS